MLASLTNRSLAASRLQAPAATSWSTSSPRLLSANPVVLRTRPMSDLLPRAQGRTRCGGRRGRRGSGLGWCALEQVTGGARLDRRQYVGFAVEGGEYQHVYGRCGLGEGVGLPAPG